MSKLSSSLIICVLCLVVQKCHGVLNVPIQDNVFVSAYTPYNKDETINYPAISKLAQIYKDQGAKVIYIFGFYGEGPSIPLPERKRLAEEWNRQTNCLGLDLIIEIGAMPFVDTLEMARYCSKLNVTAITIFAEIIYQASTLPEALEDLQRICDATGSRIPLLYHELVVVNQKIKPVEIFKGAVDRCVTCFVGVLCSVNTFLDIKASVPSIAGYLFVSYGVNAISASMKIGMNATEIVNLFPEITLKIKRAIYNCKFDLAEDEQQNINRRIYGITNPNGGISDQTTRREYFLFCYGFYGLTTLVYGHFYSYFAQCCQLYNYVKRVFRKRNFSYIEQEKAAFELLKGMDVGYRYPLVKPNSTVICEIQSNLQNLGVRLYNNYYNY